MAISDRKGVCFNTGRTHFKKGFSPHNKGKGEHSPICPTCKGKKSYMATQCKKCSDKNKTAWNKGLTAKTDGRVAKYGASGSLAKKGRSFKHSGQFKKGQAAWNYKGDQVGYHALHDRVERARGKARNQMCIDCGKQAEHWSNVDGKYGTDVYKDFQPRCVPCHRNYDFNLNKNAII